MALEKTRKRTAFQRIKRIILGKQRPNLLTRISVLVGFVVWIYLFLWQFMTLISLLLMPNLEQSDYLKPIYKKVGEYYYGYEDTYNQLLMHSFVQIIICMVLFIGLVLIWRKLKLGIVLFILGNIATLFVTYFLMGQDYLINETPIVDFVLIGVLILYFSLGFFLFYRKKKNED